METDLNFIAQNLHATRARIEAAAANCGRDPRSITLIAVSKKKSAQHVLAAQRQGQLHFGESYLQEAAEKIQQLNDKNLIWHFIGPIQKNKTRSIAQYFDWVHSLDREVIATRLNAHRTSEQGPLNVCIQINIDLEETKSGLHPDELIPLARTVSDLPNLRLRGIMALPGKSKSLAQQRQSFAQMRQLLQTLLNQGYAVDTLSMGMSDDLEAAVSEGATFVRVGSAIFGSRE